jgi:hypothetical protein
MGSFDEAWALAAKTRRGEAVSPDLRPLLQAVYDATLSSLLDQPALKTSLEHLLEFLVRDGRTNANCWAVDMFFCISEGWEKDWADQDLPEDFHDVLATMGEALHDTVYAPNIAEEYGCLPEQLLERVKKLPGG